MIRVGIVAVTGYTGAELMRLLSRHPGAQVVSITGRSEAGKPLRQVFPHLRDVDQPVTAELSDDVEVAFLGLPHHEAAAMTPPLLEKGIKVIDLSADFRLRDAAVYEEFYGHHPCPYLLAEAVYGLPEVYREPIKAARLVANPGCYPTASILALWPALRHHIIKPEVIVDAKSGVSGAGRSLKLESHFSEVNESVRAYGLDGHRHLPEINQELNVAWGRGFVRLTFVPHLIPMTRGILATAYADLTVEWPANQVYALYADFYANEPFVRVVESPPQTKQVYGSNYCYLYPTVDQRAGRLIVVAVIDNLVKGASGQAVQNLNLMAGLPETMGLEALGIYP